MIIGLPFLNWWFVLCELWAYPSMSLGYGAETCRLGLGLNPSLRAWAGLEVVFVGMDLAWVLTANCGLGLS